MVDSVSKFDDNEKLIVDQLEVLKKELKQTRVERDLYKKKYQDSITLQDGKKTELLTHLKDAFEKLVFEITLT